MTLPPDPRLVHQALAYLAALHGGDPQRAAQAGAQAARWRARAGVHEAAWHAAEARWQAVSGIAAQVRGEVPLDTALPAQRAERRRLLRRGGGVLGVFGVAALTGWLGLRQWQAPTFSGRWATRVREQLPRIPLEDGSVLALAPSGALQATFWRHRREVVLEQGHAFFDVAHDAARPFTVLTRLGQVEVVGTAFSIIDRGGDIRVQVARGQVRVRTAQGASRDLVAGQRVVLQAGAPGEAPVLGAVQSDGVGALPAGAAWREGWWWFTDTPLSDVAAEFNAYSLHPLRVTPGAAALRLTGRFPIQRPQVLLDALPRALPVRWVREGEGWVLVRAD